MNVQPNCPRCKHEKFAIISHHSLGIVKNLETKEDCYQLIDLLCCDNCGAVICQVDKAKTKLKPI